jgi:hypothetical protein
MQAYMIPIITYLLSGCDSSSVANSYLLHENVTTTTFWVGESASAENAYITNVESAWDSMWMENFGGIDTPDSRNAYLPSAFIPNENAFYFALPFNDFEDNGTRKTNLASLIPWDISHYESNQSYCKNRWIKITKDGKTAYAQWEDCGPFEYDDRAYVFGTSDPLNSENDSAGLDVSPAVRDYLGLSGIDKVSWQFVDEKDVCDGPWKDKITTTELNWVDWMRFDINTTWQWQLQGELNSSYNVNIYDVDLFDTTVEDIARLNSEGKSVICYFSAGSWEDWRDDNASFSESVKGNELDGWPGEKWLNIADESLKSIMRARLDLARDKGCKGVEPDNVDGYTNDTGFTLTAQDQLKYNKFLVYEAHKRELSIALKNDLNQIEELVYYFDFALNEQCHFYNECNLMQPFIDANKAVLNAEYDEKYVDNTDGARDDMCTSANNQGLKTLVLPMDLNDTFRISCY